MEVIYGLIGLVSILCIITIIFVVTHLRPLTEKEVAQLATKRRSKEIRMYFSFDREEIEVDKQFKKRMNPNGRFYQISEGLFRFPSVAAALMKYKKHEWIIVAFEKNKEVNRIWLNKGVSCSSASLKLPSKRIAEIAKQEKFSTILILHNHPNKNPKYYDCSRPSETDVKFAKDVAQELNRNDINLLTFVCERGRHYEHSLSPTANFLPLMEFIVMINKVNGRSKLKNVSLHFQRVF